MTRYSGSISQVHSGNAVSLGAPPSHFCSNEVNHRGVSSSGAKTPGPVVGIAIFCSLILGLATGIETGQPGTAIVFFFLSLPVCFVIGHVLYGIGKVISWIFRG